MNDHDEEGTHARGPVTPGDPSAPAGTTSAPTEQLMTLDQARAKVGRMMAGTIRRAIDATEAELAASQLEGVAAANGRVFLQAAKELHDALLIKAKQFERPAILRSPRRVRVFRG